MSFFRSNISGLLGDPELPGMGGIEQALAENAAMKRPSFFSEGGAGRNIAGFIGDYLSQLGGMQPVYGPAMEQRRLMEQQMGLYEKKRADDLEDYGRKLQIESEYKAPDLPGLADEFAWFNSLPPDQQGQVQNYMRVRYPGQFTPPTPVVMEPGDVIEGQGEEEMIAVNPQTGERVRYDPTTQQWEPIGGAGPQTPLTFP